MQTPTLLRGWRERNRISSATMARLCGISVAAYESIEAKSCVIDAHARSAVEMLFSCEASAKLLLSDFHNREDTLRRLDSGFRDSHVARLPGIAHDELPDFLARIQAVDARRGRGEGPGTHVMQYHRRRIPRR